MFRIIEDTGRLNVPIADDADMYQILHPST
jgi:hypothetical protein